MNCTTTIFVARIGNKTENTIRKIFSYYGEVLEVTILKDGEKNKCCGFIKFKRIDDAVRCVNDAKEKKGVFKFNKKMIVEWAKSSQIKESDLDKTTLYITGMDYCTEEYIYDKMSPYGQISRITIPKTDQNYIFVKFENQEDAEKAKNGEDGKRWNGKRIVIEFSEAQSSKRNRRQKATMKKFQQFLGELSCPTSPLIQMDDEECNSFDEMNESENEEWHSCDESYLQENYSNDSPFFNDLVDWNKMSKGIGCIECLNDIETVELPVFNSLMTDFQVCDSLESPIDLSEDDFEIPSTIESILV